MNTPITDTAKRTYQAHDPRDNWSYVDADVAQRLEIDRAALMEALEEWLKTEDASEDYFVSTGMKREPDHPVVAKARAALSAARANFPTP